MDKKKRTVIIGAAVVILIGGILFLGSRNNEKDETGDNFATREEWISMLSDGFGMDTYQSNEPYYSDIPASHELFHSVQASTEWGVLFIYSEKALKPAQKVTCKEVASTAAIAAGFPAEWNPAEQNKNFDSSASVEYARENGIVEPQKDDSAFMTREECEAALQAAKHLYLNQSAEEIAVAVMNPQVVDLRGLPAGSFIITEGTGGKGVITFPSSDLATITQGADGPLLLVTTPTGPVEVKNDDVILVNPTIQYPDGSAYKVQVMQDSGGKAILITEIPTIADIYDEIQLHSIIDVNTDNIIWANGVSVSPVNITNTASIGGYEIVPLSTASSHADFSIGAEKSYEITIKKGDGGKITTEFPPVFGSGEGASLMKEAKFTYPGTPGLEDFSGKDLGWEKKLEREKEDPAFGWEVTGTITFHEIQAIVDVSYQSPGVFLLGSEIPVPESVSLQINSKNEVELKYKGSIEGRVKIGSIPLTTPIPGFVVSADLYLVADLSGQITVEVGFAEAAKIEWAGTKLKRVTDSEVELRSPSLAVESDFGIGISGTLSIFKTINLVDLGIDVGLNMTAEASAVGTCEVIEEKDALIKEYTISVKLDTGVYAPILKLKVGSDSTLCKKILGVSIELTMMDKDKGARTIKEGSWEWDIWKKRITYDKDGNIIPTLNTYTTRYWTIDPTDIDISNDSPLYSPDLASVGNFPTFEFDYPDNWTVKEEFLDIFNERVVLQNNRGVEIVYSKDGSGTPVGSLPIAIEKVSKSNLFTENEGHNEFVVAKVNFIDMNFGDNGMDFNYYVNTVENYYALIELPTEPILTGMESVVQGNFSQLLYVRDGLNFPAMIKKSWVGFCASSPDGQFTSEEEQEVIAILSSLRVKE